MDWKEKWMDRVLDQIPAGAYRRRLEAELGDHLETQLHALMEMGRSREDAEAEALGVMGAPEDLQREYLAAWRKSWPGRWSALGRTGRVLAGGLGVTFGGQLLASTVVSNLWLMATSLPGDSADPWVVAIRGTVGRLNNSLFFSQFLPLLCGLLAGAIYLGYRFRGSRWAGLPISGALCLHWGAMAAFRVWFETLDNHRTFWEELKLYLPYNALYYSATFALCLLLGAVFGYGAKRHGRPTVAQ